MGAPDGGRCGFRQAEEAHLAGLDQLGHRAHGLLDRNIRVHPVLVVEVDVVHAEALQGGVTRRADVVRAAVDAHAGAVRESLVAELRGQLHLLALIADGFADELLIGERPVHVGGVEEGDAEVEGPVDGGDAIGVGGGAVELGHAHAAKPEAGDGERSGATEGAGGDVHDLE